ncbi:molybdate ABC transporter substrate-binding protein [Ferriphaselus sp. R-1]|uniref:molybdate ABC transporter substrate-binding protein n=1 Tax=Ferriphaselus sp. R-1 TaxID=1485544 RepID=UPI00055880AE|nr:molybdate ABC transporter substrate-binding protein [Ferriphaselus sp. R-1]
MKSSMTKLVAGLLLSALAQLAQAGEVNAAVAANFQKPMEEIAAAFQKDTGHTVKLSFGSSGKFYAQIKEGAPFDLFLAADVKYPKLLEEEGWALKDTRFVYALGKLVLWSAQPGLVDSKGAVLAKGKFNKVSYADPKLAPYGLAAQETLQKMKLWDSIQSKMVTGDSIGQAYQFIASGNAELGFIALSQITKDGKVSEGSYWLVSPELYNPIEQSATLLTKAKDNDAAKALLAYLRGNKKALAVIEKFGYGLK